MTSAIQKLVASSPLLAMFLVFCAGVLASVSSRTIVRVPVALDYLAGAADSKRKALFVAALFVSGLLVVYAALGVFLGVLGRLTFTIIQVNKYIFYLLGFVLFVYGLFMAGLLKIRRFPRILQFHDNFQQVQLIGAFAYGTSFALLEMPACPCCAGIILMLASLVVTHNLSSYAVLIFASFALGQAIPVLIVSLCANILKIDLIMYLASKIRRVEEHVNFIAGNILITIGLYYLIVA